VEGRERRPEQGTPDHHHHISDKEEEEEDDDDDRRGKKRLVEWRGIDRQGIAQHGLLEEAFWVDDKGG
jgi:hypothetical protein